jgi:hypothetical protein
MEYKGFAGRELIIDNKVVAGGFYINIQLWEVIIIEGIIALVIYYIRMSKRGEKGKKIPNNKIMSLRGTKQSLCTLS